MTTRRRLFRTSSETNRSENPGYSYFSSMEEEIIEKQKVPDQGRTVDSASQRLDEKHDLLLRNREHLTTIDIKK